MTKKLEQNNFISVTDIEIFSNKILLESLTIDDTFNQIIEEYSCKECLDILYKREPLQCREGHVLCKNCWDKILLDKKECIVCRIGIENIMQLSRNRFLEDLLMKKKIKCPFSFSYASISNYRNCINGDAKDILVQDLEKIKENGCNQIISIRELEDHLSNCEYRFIKCQYSNCNEICRYKELDNHLNNSCKYYQINCKLCNELITKSKLKNHLKDTCQLNEIKCNQCQKNVIRKSLNFHIERDCPNTIIKCKYSEYGCNSVVKRSNLQTHIQTINHTTLLAKFIEKQESRIKELNLENEKTNKTFNHIYDVAERYNKDKKELLKKTDILEKEVSDLKRIILKAFNNSGTTNNSFPSSRIASRLIQDSYSNDINNKKAISIQQEQQQDLDTIKVETIEIDKSKIIFYLNKDIIRITGICIDIKIGDQNFSFISEFEQYNVNKMIFIDTKINLESLYKILNINLNFDYSIVYLK